MLAGMSPGTKRQKNACWDDKLRFNVCVVLTRRHLLTRKHVFARTQDPQKLGDVIKPTRKRGNQLQMPLLAGMCRRDALAWWDANKTQNRVDSARENSTQLKKNCSCFLGFIQDSRKNPQGCLSRISKENP